MTIQMVSFLSVIHNNLLCTDPCRVQGFNIANSGVTWPVPTDALRGHAIYNIASIQLRI